MPELILIITTATLISLWLLHSILTKTIRIAFTLPLIPLLLLTLTSCLSAYLASPNSPIAILERPTLYASLTLLYLVITSVIHNTKYIIRNTIMVVVILGLVAHLTYTLIHTPPLLPWNTALTITTKTLTSPSTMLLGWGPTNFTEAFTYLKPQNFNLSSQWFIRFATSRNEPLHLATTQGILGLVSYLGLIVASVVTVFKTRRTTVSLWLLVTCRLSLVTTILMQFLLPPSLITLILFILSLSLLYPTKTHVITNQLLSWIITITTMVAITIASLFWLNQAYLANRLFQQALVAIQQNQGTQSYNLHIKAIHKNRFQEEYRTSYANTNLALAIVVNNREQISPADRENVLTLIQQAIREAKIATSLNPRKTSNWENLAGIYRQLIGTAQNADSWAIDSYQHALTTDPYNPALHLAIGGIHYSQGRYQQARTSFQTAVDLKPNWANAHYHLYLAHKDLGNLDQATLALQAVLQYLPKSSPDYAKAEAEFDSAKAESATPSSTIPNQLQPNDDTLSAPTTPPVRPDRQVNLPPEYSPSN